MTRYLGQTATPANADLDSLPQLSSLLVPMLPQSGRVTNSLEQYLANNAVFNVKDFGARGDVATDDYATCQEAIDEADDNGGGIVYFPKGAYKVTSPLIVPARTDRSIILRGAGWRSVSIRPATNGQTAVQFGAAPADVDISAAPQLHTTSYHGIEDISINGSLLTGGDGIGLLITQMLQGFIRRVVIEQFPTTGNPIGLYLLGSKTTGGLGADSNLQVIALHVQQLIVANVVRPMVLQNADENTFEEVRLGLPVGLSASRGVNSLIALEIRQGRNNRFRGLNVQGDTAAPAAYLGIKFCSPVGVDGTPQGDVKGNLIDKCVPEGLNLGVLFENSPNTTGNEVDRANFSICTANFSDLGTQNGRGSVVRSALQGINYQSFPAPYCDALTFPQNVATPSVAGGNLFASANSAPTSYTNFLNGHNGQIIAVRLDAFSTLVHGASIKCPGNQNYVAGGSDTVILANIGGVAWSVLAIVSAAGNYVSAKVSADNGDAAPMLTLASPRTQLFNTPLTANRIPTMPTAGAFVGDRFRFTRTAASTGASTLNVPGVAGGATKNLAAGQWADVEWNGAAWFQTAGGAL